jgi:hypothetical protein
MNTNSGSFGSGATDASLSAASEIKRLADEYANEAQNFHSPETDEARAALHAAIDRLATGRDALLFALKDVGSRASAAVKWEEA